MSISSSTAVQNGGNRFFLPIGNRSRLPVLKCAAGCSLPVGMDASKPVIPPESLRWGGHSLLVSAHWLQTHFGIGADVLGNALDEVMSWGVELDFSNGLWIDHELLSKLVTYTQLKFAFRPDQQQWLFRILAAKSGITKAISIRQPWAWLIVNGFKDIENRNWYTQFRGEVFIHAGKSIDRAEYAAAQELFAAIAPSECLPPPERLRRGGFVGTAEISGCVQHSLSPWFTGRFGFRLQQQKAIAFIPHKGQLGLFNVPARMVWEVGGIQ